MVFFSLEFLFFFCFGPNSWIFKRVFHCGKNNQYFIININSVHPPCHGFQYIFFFYFFFFLVSQSTILFKPDASTESRNRINLYCKIYDSPNLNSMARKRLFVYCLLVSRLFNFIPLCLFANNLTHLTHSTKSFCYEFGKNLGPRVEREGEYATETKTKSNT